MTCNHEHHDAISRRRDPTGTTVIRKRFEADLARRFRQLKGLINKSIVERDALGLKKQTIGDQALSPGAFAFNRSPDKVAGFMEWLREQQAEGILGVAPGTPIERASQSAWSNVYIESSYQKGIRDAGQKLRQAGAQVAPSFVENAFTRPIHADRVGLAFTRTFSELKGITETMDQQISRILANGIAQGQNPLKIARSINDRVDKIGITRARVLARTEVISAHSEASISAYEEAGIEGVEVEAELLTATDACTICEDLAAGGPYTLERARGMIPGETHPNCRCAVSPVVVNGTGIELV